MISVLVLSLNLAKNMAKPPLGTAPGKRLAGRKKGTPNKIQGDIRAAIHEAFTKAGGVNYLLTVAADNPAVFCGLLAKILPKQVDHTFNNLADELSRARQRVLELEAQPVTVLPYDPAPVMPLQMGRALEAAIIEQGEDDDDDD